jgi:hypothetical protein
MKDRDLFNNYMMVMGEIFNKEFTSFLVEAYWKVLTDVPDDRAVQAFKKAIATCRFFPRPAELLELAGESDRLRELMTGSQAEEQALFVLRIIGRRAKEAEVSDRVTKYLLERRFPVNRLRQSMREADERWFVKDFIAAYKSASDLSQADVLSLDTGSTALKQLAAGISNKKELGLINKGVCDP